MVLWQVHLKHQVITCSSADAAVPAAEQAVYALLCSQGKLTPASMELREHRLNMTKENLRLPVTACDL